MSKFGFIGVGNMGGALARAVVSAVGAKDVILADKSLTSAQILAEELKCSFGNNEDILLNADFIFLGSGDKEYENLFIWLSNNTPNIRTYVGYNGALANLIYAG